MNLTPNFTYEEMTKSATAQRLHLDNTPGEKEKANLKRLCEEILQPVRNKYGKPIKVSSGYRSEAVNKAVNGAPASQHKAGEAADIKCDDNRKLWALIVDMMKSGEIRVGQLIDEKKLQWIHISLPTLRHNNRILHL